MGSFKFPNSLCAGVAHSPAWCWSDALAQRHRGHVVVERRLSLLRPVLLGLLLGSPFWGPYGYWPPPYAYYGGYDYASDARIMATPREAEV